MEGFNSFCSNVIKSENVKMSDEFHIENRSCDAMEDVIKNENSQIKEELDSDYDEEETFVPFIKETDVNVLIEGDADAQIVKSPSGEGSDDENLLLTKAVSYTHLTLPTNREV